MSVAFACLAAFCTASRQVKYAVASIVAAYLPMVGHDLDRNCAGADGDAHGRGQPSSPSTVG
jgi:hypothetical protein